MRDLEDYHVDTRGFRAVGYSFVIMPGGRTYEGRGWGMLGAHTLRRNGNSYGIALVGNFDEDQPTPEALSACLALIRLGIEGGHLSGTDHPTGGHGDVADTPCPGVNLTSWLRGARAELRPSR
jgi:N-acetylmuramoyl-L-alanine amidase